MVDVGVVVDVGEMMLLIEDVDDDDDSDSVDRVNSFALRLSCAF